ncbi:MAG: O-antigen ligase family protein, partial [Candidatus Eutrophobiaceae bacterium]
MNRLSRISGHLPALLLFIWFATLSSKSLPNLWSVLLGLAGLALCCAKPREVLRDPLTQLLGLLFLCLWLPMLFALPDAVDLKNSSRVAFGYVRFFFAGILLLWLRQARGSHALLETALIGLLLFWGLNELARFALKSFLMDGWMGNALSVLVWEYHRIGNVLALLSPLLFLRMWRQPCSWWTWPAALALYLAVLVSGSRSAWFILIFSLCVCSLPALAARGTRLRNLAILATLCAVLGFAGNITIHHSPFLQDRAAQTSRLAAPTVKNLDYALSGRLQIWQHSFRIFLDHPVNGIGPKGLRILPESRLANGAVMHHPHLFILEIAAETGIPGLVGYALFCWICLCAWLRCPQRPLTLTALLILAIAAFPFSVHAAFYGSQWSGVLWACILLFLS